MDSRLATALDVARLCRPPLADHEVDRLVRPRSGRPRLVAAPPRTLPIDATKTGFLDLPRELRDHIYGYIIASSAPPPARPRVFAPSCPDHRHTTTTTLDLPLPPPITRVSALLRAEALPRFYAHATTAPVTLLLSPLQRPLRTTVCYLLSLSPFHLSCIRAWEIRSPHGAWLGLGAGCVYTLVYVRRERCWRVGVRREGAEGRVVRDVLFEDLEGVGCAGLGVGRAKAEAMEGFLGARGRGGSGREEGLALQDLVALLGGLAC